jgi:hypothetical protein
MAQAAYRPYAPLDVLKPVADAVWIVDGPEIAFGYLGLKMPFPTRMTVVRLAGSGLWLHSPTAASPALVAQVAALGPVRWLIAPNTLHYWWAPDWRRLFPEAELWAAPGVAERAERARRPLAVDHRLGAVAPAAWSGEIDQLLVAGDVLTEAVFFHRPSRTLVLTDLIENFELARLRSPLWRALVRVGGAADPDGSTPHDMRFTFRRQRAALRAAAEQMLAWDPERVILAHGRWYETGGAAELRRAFRWVL